jgi:hypothetical protein
MCWSLVVPVEAIEFPETWYQGARTSNTQLLADFRHFLKERAAIDKANAGKQQAGDSTGAGKVLLTCVSLVVLMALLIVMLSP